MSGYSFDECIEFAKECRVIDVVTKQQRQCEFDEVPENVEWINFDGSATPAQAPLHFIIFDKKVNGDDKQHWRIKKEWDI